MYLCIFLLVLVLGSVPLDVRHANVSGGATGESTKQPQCKLRRREETVSNGTGMEPARKAHSVLVLKVVTQRVTEAVTTAEVLCTALPGTRCTC